MNHELTAIICNADIYSIRFNVLNKLLYMWTNRSLTNNLIWFINPYRFSHLIHPKYPIDHSTLQTIAKMLAVLCDSSSRCLSRSVMGGGGEGYHIVCHGLWCLRIKLSTTVCHVIVPFLSRSVMTVNQAGKSRTSDFRSTGKYREVQGSTGKYREVQRSTEKYHSFFSFFFSETDQKCSVIRKCQNFCSH